MKKAIRFLSLLLSLVLLTGCAREKSPEESGCSGMPIDPPEVETTAPETTPPETTIPAAEMTTPVASTVPATQPEHSQLYIPGVSIEDVILYFN